LSYDATTPSEPTQTEVDLDARGQSLKDALDRYVPHLQRQAEDADADNQWLTDHGKPFRAKEIVQVAAMVREFALTLEQHAAEAE
jgi:hypothetical protein